MRKREKRTRMKEINKWEGKWSENILKYKKKKKDVERLSEEEKKKNIHQMKEELKIENGKENGE